MLGYVPGDLRRTDYRASSVPHRRYIQRNVDQMAVLMLPDGAVVVDRLPASDPREDPRLLVDAVGRHQYGYGLPDHLVGGVAEDRLGPQVPALNHPVKILADDRV